MGIRLNADVVKGRLARRMLGIFVLCAILPLAALTGISLITTRANLEAQAHERLHETTKAFGMSLLERLLFAETELRLLAREFARGEVVGPVHEYLDRFYGVAMVLDGAEIQATGTPGPIPELSAESQVRLAEGGLVAHFIDAATSPRLVMAVLIDPGQESAGWAYGLVRPDYAWGEALLVGLPEGTQMLLATPQKGVLLNTLGVPVAGLLRDMAVSGSTTGALDWIGDGTAYVAAHWQLPLGFRFGTQGIDMALLEPQAAAFSAARGFGRNFMLSGLATLWIVLLLSISQIRSNLDPLAHLQAATEHMAQRDFSHRVEVTSRDEFQDLAESFNAMSARLGSQFEHLATMGEIDRAILGSVQVDAIARNAVHMLEDSYPETTFRFGVLRDDGRGMRLFGAKGSAAGVILTDAEAEALDASSGHSILSREAAWPSYLSAALPDSPSSALVIPLRVDGSASGTLLVGFPERGLEQDDIAQLDQIAEQLSMALSSARLVSQLEQTKQGALIALARAVDAKSQWTRGHSERVTDLAVKIGRELGLPEATIEILSRGGLLHDIGKIGVPKRRARQARASHRRGVRAHKGASGDRRPHSGAHRGLCRRHVGSAPPPREARRYRLPRRAGGRRDQLRGAHHGCGRCVRRGELGPTLSRRHAAGALHEHHPRGVGQPFRPGGGGGLRGDDGSRAAGTGAAR